MRDHTETQIAGIPKAESPSFRSKRLRILSAIDLSLSFAFVMASFVQVWLTTKFAPTLVERAFVAITNPITVMAGAWVVLNGFSYVLDKSTVFVGRLDKWSRS